MHETPSPASPPALPPGLARVLVWLQRTFAEPVNLDRMAAVAGIRPRTLEKQFRSYLGTTPLAWVRRMRLAHARRELQCGAGAATVTDVALASGFGQLGRFATRYRAAYGEAPSTTLRRRQRAATLEDHAVDDEAVRLTWLAMPDVLSVAPRECDCALERLEQASRIAPGYGLPVATAAWCWGQRGAHGFDASPLRDRQRTLELARRAAALSPSDALALTFASGALTLAHRLDEADRLLERALALDAGLPYAWVRRGWASVYQGDPQAGLRELAVALRLAPLGSMRSIAFIGVGSAHFALGNYGAAARWVQSGTCAFPGAVWADRLGVAAAVHAGAKDEARRMGRRLLRRDPDLTVERARAAWPFRPPFMARLADGLKAAGVPLQ